MSRQKAEGSHEVILTVTDVAGTTDTQTYDVSVANVNDEPIINSSPLTDATEEVLYNYDVDADDDDFRTLNPSEIHKYSLDKSPDGMIIDNETGLISWTPTNEQAEGTHEITVKVTDSENSFNTQSFEIDVENVNDLPSITTSTSIEKIDEQTLFTYDVDSGDDDFRTLNPTENHEFSLDVTPAGMTINSATGLIEWVPTTKQAFAKYDMTVKVTDIEGISDSQNFSLFVADTTPPEITIVSAPTGFINVDGMVTFKVFELHEDNPIIAISPNTSFSRINFDNNVGTYIANNTPEGLYDVIITATDQSKNIGTDSSVSFSIDKTAPVTNGDNYSEWHTEDISIPLNADDPVSGGVSSGLVDTYYIIYEDDDNWIEYWSVDVAGNFFSSIC